MRVCRLIVLSCATLSFSLLWCSAATNRIDRPDFFKTLVNPDCSHCVDEGKRRVQDLRPDDRVLAWIRGKYDGGAIPFRFFLVPYRVISDTYGVFVYDVDAGFTRGYEPSLDFSFQGWRDGVMTIREKDGTLYSALTGIAFDGPKKGTRLKPIPTLESDWGYWLKAYPATVAYHMFDKYVPFDIPTGENADSVRTRPVPDNRLAPDQLIVGIELDGMAKAYPISILATNRVIRDKLGERDLVVLWYEGTRTAAIYAPRMENDHVPEKLKLEHNPQIPTAPFMDKETFSHWTIEGRAVNGPLKGKSLQWLPGVQCKWFAWAAEYPDTHIYSATDPKPEDPVTQPIAKLIQGERLDWDRLAKTYARIIRIDPTVKRITLLSESDYKERTIHWSIDTEFYSRGAWGNATDLLPDQRVYVLATTDADKNWVSAHALSDEMSMQGMSRPYVLKQYDKENGKVYLVDETGVRSPLDLQFDSRSVFVTASSDPLPIGQDCYCNTRTGEEGRLVMELLDATSFVSEQRRRFQLQLETVVTNGLAGRVLAGYSTNLTNHVSVLLRRGHSWIGRSLQLGEKVRVQITGDESPKRATITEIRPDYSRLRIGLEVLPETVPLFRPGAEIRLFAKTPKTLDPSMPIDLGRFTNRQDRVDYFLSTVYCTCGMMGTACAGHWNTLAACKIHGCGMPNIISRLIGEWMDAGLTDAQILDALIKREGPLLLRQHQY